MSKYINREEKKIVFKADSPFSLLHLTVRRIANAVLFTEHAILCSGPAEHTRTSY